MNTNPSQGETSMNTTTTLDFAAEYDRLQTMVVSRTETIASLAEQHERAAATDLTVDGQLNYDKIVAMRKACDLLEETVLLLVRSI
jgi:hypothetical protein